MLAFFDSSFLDNYLTGEFASVFILELEIMNL